MEKEREQREQKMELGSSTPYLTVSCQYDIKSSVWDMPSLSCVPGMEQGKEQEREQNGSKGGEGGAEREQWEQKWEQRSSASYLTVSWQYSYPDWMT